MDPPPPGRPTGHIQAIGTDTAGRRQYLYHPRWRQRRDAEKFDHVLTVARRLPWISAYLREAAGCEVSANDFRTWHATVLAAMLFAHEAAGGSRTRRERVAAAVVRGVAGELGNTPTVARTSYIDPRVVDPFLAGTTIPRPTRRALAAAPPAPRAVERAVLTVLHQHGAHRFAAGPVA
ncbi:hypothetical protein GCM10009682_00080 [Luedemannella flava]|uniref:DNA topoisomerase IB n=1 Tax=Luedemannella flava TaxID=349316 RepID=A0ABN2LAZ7_9ACTN